MRTPVLYVHGLWMPGVEALWLRRALRRAGFALHLFRYGEVRQSIGAISAALRAAIATLPGPEVHLVGHSLGGLMILRCLERYGLARPGRVVFLGTPANGSVSARRLAASRLGRRLLGAAAEELLAHADRCWRLPQPLGVIAGTRPIGAGRLLLRFGQANDGTVAVAETRLAGASDHLSLPVSHTGLLLSGAVAYQTGYFLAHGRFEH